MVHNGGGVKVLQNERSGRVVAADIINNSWTDVRVGQTQESWLELLGLGGKLFRRGLEEVCFPDQLFEELTERAMTGPRTLREWTNRTGRDALWERRRVFVRDFVVLFHQVTAKMEHTPERLQERKTKTDVNSFYANKERNGHLVWTGEKHL